MKSIFSKFFVIFSIGLGILFYFILISMHHPIVILVGYTTFLLYQFIFNFLTKHNLIEENDLVDFCPTFAAVSLATAGYFYLSNGLENWFSAIFITLFYLAVLYYIHCYVIGFIIDFYQNIKNPSLSESSTSRKNDYSTTYPESCESSLPCDWGVVLDLTVTKDKNGNETGPNFKF